MQDWIVIFAAIAVVSATGCIVMGILWLHRLRQSVASALAEAANQQVRTAQRLGDTLAQLQKQQRNYEQQLQNLAQAGLRLRQEIVNVSSRLEHRQADLGRGDHTLH